MLSERGQVLANSQTLPYITEVIKGLNNLYDEQSNPNGCILMAVAENKLMKDELMQKISTIDLSMPVIKQYLLNYTLPTGLPIFKDCLSKFLSTFIFNNHPVDPNNLVVSSGCVAALVHLSWFLFEDNDSILVPTPYYPAFNKDFLNLGKVHCVSVELELMDHNPLTFASLSRTALDKAFEKAIGLKHPPKALLITNPNNPTGTIYSNEELDLMISWCKEKHLHLIVDEIYALSILEPTFSDNATTSSSQTKFQSIVTKLQNNLGDSVHVLWALSKDFGASGLRVGVLYTQNNALLQGVGQLNDVMQVSNMAQITAKHILEDHSFVRSYLKANQSRLRVAYEIVHSHFKELGIKVIPAAGGIFAFCDFRLLLNENSFAAERILYQQLCSKGIVFTPGESCHCHEPGFFRVCYAWVPENALREALKRIKQFFLDYLMVHGGYGLTLCLAMNG